MGGGHVCNIVVRASRVTGVAPLGVVFDAALTTHSNPSIKPMHNLLFFWDFGDASAEVYTNALLAGKTTNEYLTVGLTASHFYTQGGTTSTPRVWAHDGTTLWGPVGVTMQGPLDTPTANGNITVQTQDSVYPGTATVCVSSSGTFTGAPAGCTQVTSSDFDAVMATHFATNKRVLFRGGEAFDFSANTNKGAYTRNVVLDSFGGGRATFRPTSAGLTMLQGLANASNPANNPDNWTLANYICDANGFPDTQWFSSGIIQDVSGDVGAKSYTRGNMGLYNIETTDGGGIGNLVGFGMLASKCRIPKVRGGVQNSGFIGVYAVGLRLGLIDNYIDCQHGGEHCLRTHTEIVSVVSNYTARPAATKHYITLRGLGVATPANGVDTQYLTADYNTIDGSLSTVQTDWVCTIAPTNSTSAEYIKNVSFNNNFFKEVQGQQLIATVARYVSVLNNVFAVASGSVSSVAVSVGNPNGVMNQPTGDFYIRHNTLRLAGVNYAAFVTLQSTVAGCQISNNIAYAPNQSAPTFIQTGSTGVSPVYSGNSSDAQMKNTDPLFSGAQTSFTGSQLLAGSPYLSFAAHAGIQSDGLGYLREGASVDAGALNGPANRTDAWTLVP